MATLFAFTVPPEGVLCTTIVAYQSDTGEMGFQLDDELHSDFLGDAWILDRKNMIFEPPKAASADQLAVLRRNMTPVSVAIDAPDLEGQSLCRSQKAFRTKGRIEALKSRLGAATISTTAPPWIDLLADPDGHPEAVDRILDHAKALQVWGFGDRGRYVRINHRGASLASTLTWLERICRQRGYAMRVVESSADVPSW